MRMTKSLMSSQFAARDVLERQRRDTLRALLTYAAASPFYAGRLSPVIAPAGEIDLDGWKDIEPMSRDHFVQAQGDLRCGAVPAAHGLIRIDKTLGSSPLRVPKTVMADTAESAAILRHHAWHGIDHRRDLAQILALPVEPRRRQGVHVDADHWGEPWTPETERGRIVKLSLFASFRHQLEWLGAFDTPVYLATTPSNLIALADYLDKTGASAPKVAGVLSAGEAVTGDVRTLCARHWPEIIDFYATAACGAVAGQCPDGEGHHVFSEICLVEILDDDARPCAPGQQGWVTVTPYYNYAAPLIRYQPGDRAAWGGPCACGRALPVLKPEISRPEYAIALGIDAHWHAPADLHRALNGALPECRWRIVHTAARTLELVYMRMAGAGEPDIPGALKALRARAARRVKIDVTETDVLGPGPDGKFASLVSANPRR